MVPDLCAKFQPRTIYGFWIETEEEEQQQQQQEFQKRTSYPPCKCIGKHVSQT